MPPVPPSPPLLPLRVKAVLLAPPTKHSFPMRNITMSGLGRASIIIEAGEHSGTRIQARVGVE
ncbi:hypothetical protein BV508_12135, partial [Mycobacterium intermedium]